LIGWLAGSYAIRPGNGVGLFYTGTPWTHTGETIDSILHACVLSLCVLHCGVVLQAALKLKQKMFREDWEFFKAQRRLLEQALPKHRQAPTAHCHSRY